MNQKEIIETLQARIPVLNGEKQVIRLNMTHFKRMTDTEFMILWNLPNLTILCNKDVIEYIDKRRYRLGLPIGKHSKIN